LRGKVAEAERGPLYIPVLPVDDLAARQAKRKSAGVMANLGCIDGSIGF